MPRSTIGVACVFHCGDKLITTTGFLSHILKVDLNTIVLGGYNTKIEKNGENGKIGSYAPKRLRDALQG